jgi:hypothetical protein
VDELIDPSYPKNGVTREFGMVGPIFFDKANWRYSPPSKESQTLRLQMDGEPNASKAQTCSYHSPAHNIRVSSSQPPFPSSADNQSVSITGVPKDMATFHTLEGLEPICHLRELRRANDKTVVTEIAIAWFGLSEVVSKLMRS